MILGNITGWSKLFEAIKKERRISKIKDGRTRAEAFVGTVDMVVEQVTSIMSKQSEKPKEESKIDEAEKSA